MSDSMEGSTAGVEVTHPRRRWWKFRLVAVLVVVAILVATVTLSVLVRNQVGSEERSILRERAGQVALLLNESEETIATLLPIANSESTLGLSATSPFHVVASALVGAGDSAVVVYGPRANNYGVIAHFGPGGFAPATSASLDVLLKREETTKGLTSGLVTNGAKRWIAILASTPGSRVTVYQEALAKATPIPTTVGSPFADIDVALYGPDGRTAADLFAVSGAYPTGDVMHESLQIGTSTWPLLVSASQPLVGTVAQWSPWLFLAGGLVTALLVGALVEGLSRRREFAMVLVRERTATLEGALEEGRRLQGVATQAREEAEAANRSKSEFLSRMSHELRTPLNAVVGFAQLLALDELSEDQQDSVDHIQKGGQHLLNLINEVLDISRIEAGDFALSWEPVLVSDALEGALGLIRPIAEQRSITLMGSQGTKCQEYVLADRHRLQQVLLNLMSNAVKYNHRGGSVWVSCRHVEATKLQILVTDTGPGIAEEQHDRLFTPFDRLGAERSEIEGTGIGLALSRQLVQAMGGTIGVETEAGKGSTFYVELPLAEGPVDRLERLGPQLDVATPSVDPANNRTVLYIEDNLANVKLVQRIVAQREGVEVISAMQGRLGLELAKEHLPILILLDLHLPDISGDEVLQQLRIDPITAKIPVVMVSADATSGQTQRLINAGALDYLTKPFEVHRLLTLLDGALANMSEPV